MRFITASNYDRAQPSAIYRYFQCMYVSNPQRNPNSSSGHSLTGIEILSNSSILSSDLFDLFSYSPTRRHIQPNTGV